MCLGDKYWHLQNKGMQEFEDHLKLPWNALNLSINQATLIKLHRKLRLDNHAFKAKGLKKCLYKK